MSTFRTSCAEQRLQFLPRGHADHVRHVGGVERGGDLRVEVDAVHHDDHRGVAELRVQPQLLRGEDHQQRLAAALEMPDQALLRVALHHALDDLVRGVVLLVAADDLDAPVLLVRGEEREVLQDVEHHLGPEHALDRRLHVGAVDPSSWLSSSRHGPHMSIGMRIEP